MFVFALVEFTHPINGIIIGIFSLRLTKLREDDKRASFSVRRFENVLLFILGVRKELGKQNCNY